MIQVTNVLNPLTGQSETTSYPWVKGQPLSGYIGYEGECVVSCDDGIVELPVTEILPARGEKYAVAPIPEGGDRTQWRNIANLAIMAGTMYIPGAPVAKATLGWIGGNLVNAFLQDKAESPHSTSPSYAWQHQSSPTASRTLAMPVVYGTARVRPTCKNRFIEVVNGKQHLSALYGVTAHKVDERVLKEVTTAQELLEDPYYNEEFVSNITGEASTAGATLIDKGGSGDITGHGTASFWDQIVVNGRSISEYNADVTWETRPGLAEQTVITGFDATYSTLAKDESLYLDFPVVDRDNVEFTWSGGFLYWSAHTIMFNGVLHTMDSGNVSATAKSSTETQYACWKEDATKYSIGHYGTILSGYYGVAYYEPGKPSTMTYPHESEVPATDDWYTSAMSVSGAHQIELMFEFPTGLHGVNTKGDLTIDTCRLFAQYRKRGDTEWSDFHFGRSIQDNPRHTAYTIDSVIPRGDRLDNVSIGRDVATAVLKKKTTKSFVLSVRALEDNYEDGMLDTDAIYDVRVAAISPRIIKLIAISTITYGNKNLAGDRPGFTYPGEALLGIKALASGHISGDLDVQVDVTRSWVWVYNTRSASWVKGAATNHAWAVYDILAQGHPDHPAYPTFGNDDAEAIYGCGVDKDRLDYESFRTWAENIDDLGYELNIVYDTFMSAWDAILRICQEGRGMVYPVGTTMYAFTDKAEAVSQVFTQGNIHAFTQEFQKASKRVDMVEITYFDAERNYERTSIAVKTPEWDTNTTLNRPLSITLYGTTDYDQAISIGKYILLSSNLLDNAVSMGVDVEALGVSAGAVIEVQHDVITTGQGGRIESVDVAARSVTFDRTLVIAAGTTYELVIYHEDGVIDRVSVTGTTNSATLTWGAAAWALLWTTVPSAYEVYSFGVAGTHAKTYRVAGIGRTNELMRALTLLEYDAGLYEAYSPVDGAPDAGVGFEHSNKIAISDEGVEDVANLLNIASNLRLRELISRNRVTGEYESVIVALWDTVDGDPSGSWDVWVRDVDAGDLDWQGSWVSEYNESDGYSTGDKVEHEGKTYICLEDSTTSAPI